MAVESCVHISEDGAPTVKSRDTKSMFHCSTMGTKPRMVVIVVRKIGRKRCAQVSNAASNAGTF